MNSFVLAQTEWKMRLREFEAVHRELFTVRRSWAKAWDSLEVAAQANRDDPSLYRQLFEPSGEKLDREGIPALVPLFGLRDRVRELLRWGKARIGAHPIAAKAVACMAAVTLTVGAGTGAVLWHHHRAVAGAGIGSNAHAGVNRH